MKWVLFIVALLVLASVVAVLFGLWRFERDTKAVVSTLGGRARATEPFSQSALEGLPAPVSRYLKLVLREGQPLVRAAVVHQRGQFWVDASQSGESGWREFDATQHFSAEPPGFVWDARIRMAPLVDVRVRDAYARGEGSMHVRLLGVVPLVSEEHKEELSLGALQRYLAEAAWFPTVLLPGSGVEWSEVDDASAVATMADAEHKVSLMFHFDQAGRIVEVFTETRFREVEGEYVPTPWRGTFGKYEERGGVLVPTEAEVEWILPEGPYPYWRGRIESIDYDWQGGFR